MKGREERRVLNLCAPPPPPFPCRGWGPAIQLHPSGGRVTVKSKKERKKTERRLEGRLEDVEANERKAF